MSSPSSKKRKIVKANHSVLMTILVDMLDDMAERFEHLPALMRTHDDGFTRISYKDAEPAHSLLHSDSNKLVLKVGDRVYLSGANHPVGQLLFWNLVAGAVVYLWMLQLTPVQAITIDTSAQAKVGIFDNEALDTFANELSVEKLDMTFMAEEIIGAEDKTKRVEITTETLASILYTRVPPVYPKVSC